MNKILVICEGNICRSPMAEAMLQHDLPSCHVQSAGLGALIGAPADPIARQLLSRLGLSIDSHRAVQVTQAMINSFDLLLVMERTQVQRLLNLAPQARGRTFLLGHHSGEEIVDPYRRGEAAFESALLAIQRSVAEWKPRIEKIIETERR